MAGTSAVTCDGCVTRMVRCHVTYHVTAHVNVRTFPCAVASPQYPRVSAIPAEIQTATNGFFEYCTLLYLIFDICICIMCLYYIYTIFTLYICISVYYVGNGYMLPDIRYGYEVQTLSTDHAVLYSCVVVVYLYL